MLRPLVVLALAVALGGACGGRTSTDDVTGLAPELLTVDGGGPWVAPALEGAVARARWLKPEPAGDVPALPLTITIGQLTGAAQLPVLRLVAEPHPPEAWRGRFGDELETVIEIEPKDGAIDPIGHGGLALERALAVLDAKVGIELEGRAAISTLLAADDPQIVVLALDWILHHRGREYADDVARLVQHPDERVALRAVECLGIVGEPRHARVLVRMPRLADRAYAQRIYDALARLGGEEAQGFLEFAARNEDDPLMMEVAADALSRLSDEGATTGPQVGRAGRGHR